MAQPRRDLFVVVVAAWMAACGGRSSLDLGSTGAPDPGSAGGPVDAGVLAPSPDAAVRRDAGPSCTSVCAVGASRCEAGGVSTCAAGANGCAAWGAPAPCLAHQSCTASQGVPPVASCACSAGYALVAGACTLVVGSIPAPRAIAPLSTATVTSQSPVLKWALGSGDDGAVVDLCADRACTKSVTSFVVAGASGHPPAALTKGLHYWRLRGTANGAVGAVASPVWELFVGARSAPVDTSWGTTLDVNGDGLADVLVGASAVNKEAGAAYLYLSGGAALSTTPITVPAPAGPWGRFGKSVASAGDVNGDGFADVIIGAYGMNGFVGAAYVYLGGAGGLSTAPTVLNGPGTPYGSFGWSVASAGDVDGDGFADVVVGASGTGAFVFRGSAAGTSTTAIALSAPAGATAGYGGSVASAGDVNGDGYADLVVGAPASAAGHACVYLGGPAGISQTPTVLVAPVSPYNLYFGYSVASAGDVNGDGFADVLVGAPNLYDYGFGPGQLYLGGSGGVSTVPTTLVQGFAVAGAGDVNGDGYDDVAVGTPDGVADVYLGSAVGLSKTYTALPPPTGSSPSFGFAIAGAGDVNGDGFADLVVGAPSPGTIGVYLFPGAAAGLATTPATVLLGPSVGTGFGQSLATWVRGASSRRSPS